jgi:hypothetical protein
MQKKIGSEFCLYAGMKQQIGRDADPYKKLIFRQTILSRIVLRAGYQLMCAHAWFGVMAVVPFFLIHLLKARFICARSLLLHPIGQSERDSLKPIFGNLSDYRSDGAWYWVSALRGVRLFQLVRIFSRLVRRFELYQVLRVAQYFAYYFQSRAVVLHFNLRGVVSCTDSNPHGLALLQVARSLGRKSVFIAHGEPTVPAARLVCDLAFLFGQNSVDRYEQSASRLGKVLLKGHSRAGLPRLTSLGEVKVLGIFLGKVISAELLDSLIQWASHQTTLTTLILRPHPKFPLPKTCFSYLDGQSVILSSARLIPDDVSRCDLVLAGNSTAHLDVLLAGKRSAYFSDAGPAGHDRYGYVGTGLVPLWNPTLTLEDIDRHYRTQPVRSKLDFHLSTQSSEAESYGFLLREMDILEKGVL